MAQIRYLLVLSAVALSLVEPINCHPQHWALSRQPDNSDLLSAATSKETKGQTSQPITGPKSRSMDCPWTCTCNSTKDLNITIRDCETDPSQALINVFAHNMFIEINIVNANLPVYPCKPLRGQSKMTMLRLWRNNIKTVSCNIAILSELKTLDLTWNKLATIPVDILVTKLDTLLLSHNKIMEVSPFAYRCASTLDLSHNFIKDMPSLSSVMPRIHNLNLSHNMFESIPCNLTTLDTLQTLDLGYNAIRGAPCSMADMGVLWRLVLSHNQFDEIPKNVTESNVADLDISYNTLVSVSCDLVAILWLQKLDISHNAIAEIACNTSTSHLTELNLSYNILDTVPCNLSFMADLTMLNLSHNSLKNGGCNLPALPSLEILDIGNNYLTMIPFNLSMMPELSYLDLSWNQLVRVPNDLLTMPKLQNLKLSNNALKKFPNAPSIVPSLQWLDLSNNFLETLPFGKTKFRSLKMLDLSGNSLQHVSAEALLSLNNVQEIYLNDNKLQRLPDDIASVTLGPKTHLHLSKNQWICDCQGRTTRDWIVANYETIEDVEEIRCDSPNIAKGRQMVNMDSNIFCPYFYPKGMYTTIGVLVGVISLLLACFPLVCIIRIRNTVEVHQRKAWEPEHWDEVEDEGKEFDVFVSYANEDEEYVGEYLIPELEARGFKICFHRVHFLGGKSIIDNICECIAKSKKMLVFYSYNFTKSNFGMYEFNMAMELDAQNATTRLVTIKDTDVDIHNLRITHSTYFRTNSYIIREERRFWDNLVYTLPQHRMGIVEDPDDEN